MSLLIKGGDIVDGSGGPPKKGDVLIASDRIVAIGNLASYKADRTISANGMLVVPGFLDMASSADKRLSFFPDRSESDLLLEGITTVICGTGGISLAPIIYGSLESLSPWSKWEAMNIDWHSVSDLLSVIDGSRIGVNFASFAGYGTIKSSLSKKRRGLSKSESSVISHMLSQAIREGALGISVSSDDSAGSDMSPDEIKSFGSVLKEEKAILAADLPFGMKHPSESVENIIKWTRGGIPTIIHHLSRASVSEKETSASLQAMENASVSARITGSACPLAMEELQLRDIVPEFIESTDAAGISADLLKKRAMATMEKNWPIKRLSSLWIADSPKAEFLVGKNVAEFAENREVGPAECFSKLVEISGGRISFYLVVQRDSSFDRILFHPRVAIESMAYGSISERSDFHKKLTGAFPEFLDAANKGGLSIEKTIAKITSLPASACDMTKRGLIKEGFSADIVVLKDRRPEWVVVNGIESVKDGVVVTERGGRVIRRNA